MVAIFYILLLRHAGECKSGPTCQCFQRTLLLQLHQLCYSQMKKKTMITQMAKSDVKTRIPRYDTGTNAQEYSAITKYPGHLQQSTYPTTITQNTRLHA